MVAVNTDAGNEFRIELRICDFNALTELSALVAVNTDAGNEFRISAEIAANARTKDIFFIDITLLVDILDTMAAIISSRRICASPNSRSNMLSRSFPRKPIGVSHVSTNQGSSCTQNTSHPVNVCTDTDKDFSLHSLLSFVSTEIIRSILLVCLC